MTQDFVSFLNEIYPPKDKCVANYLAFRHRVLFISPTFHGTRFVSVCSLLSRSFTTLYAEQVCRWADDINGQ